MTLEEVRNHQRAFEVAGSVICSFIFGFLFWIAEVDAGLLFDNHAPWHVMWSISLTAACYLGVFIYLDRRAEQRQWESRPNWLLIALCGTTLLCFVNLSPIMFQESGYHVRQVDEKVVGFCAVLLILNTIAVISMGAVWLMGHLIRARAQWPVQNKIVP